MGAKSLSPYAWGGVPCGTVAHVCAGVAGDECLWFEPESCRPGICTCCAFGTHVMHVHEPQPLLA